MLFDALLNTLTRVSVSFFLFFFCTANNGTVSHFYRNDGGETKCILVLTYLLRNET